MRIAKYIVVHLADDEWSSQENGQLMANVAQETLRRFPQIDFVEVYEHGGWFLSYDRTGNIIGTANDMAGPNLHRQAFWEQFQDHRCCGYIRRQDDPDRVVWFDLAGQLVREEVAV